MPVVLVIEDEKNVLENISEILEIENYKVLKAENGRSGIEAAKAYKPDIIICDIMMPELSGYDVLLQLRKDPETFYIPFIFLSAKAEKQDQRAGMNLGADDYLTKPYKNKELLEAVETRLIKEKINKSHAEKKLNKLRENLALSLPHELRTPLNGILGFSQLLKMDFREMDPDEAEIMIDNIYDSGLRLNRLIVNYLLYANLLEITSSDSWKTEEVIFNPRENVSLITRRLLDNHDRQLSLDCDSSAIQINM
ncbi:MAG: response regulator, partial [Candidatus Kapaibacterium sp.]